MKNTSVRISVFVAPLLFAGFLQLSGCARREVPPPDPGGIYQSTSGGAQFDQAARLINGEGTLIGYLDNVSFRKLYRSPTEPRRVYAVARGQGIFKSDTNGESWQRLAQPLAAVSDIVELNGGSMLLSGATGEGNGAVVRSLDQGKSWEPVLQIPKPKKESSRFYEVIKPPDPPPVYVTDMAVDPFQENQVYAATTTGEILIGSDAGKVWRAIQRLTGARDPLTRQATAPIQQIVPSLHISGEILVVTTSGTILRITAEGKETLGISGVRAVHFIPQLPNSLLAAISRGVAISHDRGATWSTLPLPLSQQVKISSLAVMVSPTNPQRILVAAENILYRSEDGGVTWNSLALKLPQHTITDISINPANAAQVLLVTAPVAS